MGGWGRKEWEAMALKRLGGLVSWGHVLLGDNWGSDVGAPYGVTWVPVAAWACWEVHHVTGS